MLWGFFIQSGPDKLFPRETAAAAFAQSSSFVVSGTLLARGAIRQDAIKDRR